MRNCTMSTPPADLTDAVGTRHRPFEGEARIVSLVPSITELLCELGLAGALVGRTGFCIHPRETLRDIAKVGGTKDVKLDAVRALAPTHLVVNIDENPREVVEALHDSVPHVVVTHPCAPADNLALFGLLGGIFGREAEAARLQAALREALDETAAVAAALPPERVLYLIWRAPWMTVARDTYISAMLATVGWETLPAVHGGEAGAARYPAFEWDAPWLEGVDRVLLSTEPYRFEARHVDEVAALAHRPAGLIDGEMASWYGSRAIEGLRYLADLRRALSEGARATV
ncbi:MAG: ABC transporter substrate-binding protein [Thauera phenolivorans]|uniref:ABC transporter substrate-binding protein n=2 Tax=Thauera phenolivorans TaxID=1792543 RepID=A0A7X7LYA5_9RHOO|nr:ABC transporter substrate-binding protein [Thauera phenolivorans]